MKLPTAFNTLPTAPVTVSTTFEPTLLATLVKALPQPKPVIAIGGITIEDIESLMKIGVHGIAVSGAIVNDAHPAKKTKEFLKEIAAYEGINA